MTSQKSRDLKRIGRVKWLEWILRNFKTFIFGPELSFLMEITKKEITRVNLWSYTNSAYIWFSRFSWKFFIIIYRMNSLKSKNSPLSLFLWFSSKGTIWAWGWGFRNFSELTLHMTHFKIGLSIKWQSRSLIIWPQCKYIF